MHQADDLSAKVTGAIGWVVLERWGSRLLSLGVLVVLTRLVAPSEFGLVALAASIALVLQVFVDSGFSKALIQRRTLDEGDADTAFWTSLGVAVALALCLAAAAPWIAEVLGQEDLTLILQVLSLSLPLAALSQTPAALLERDLNFKALSVRQLAGAVGGAVAAVPLALLGAGIWALVAQSLVAATLSVAVLWASTPWRPSFTYSRRSFVSLWSVGSSMLAIDLLDAVQANVDKLVIGAFFSSEQLGYYYLAQRIGTILIDLVTTVISRVSFTTFARIQDDPARINRLFGKFTFLASAISVPMFALVAALAPQVVPFVFGEGWEEAVPIIWILAPGWVASAVMYFDRSVLLGTGRAKTALGLSVFQNVVGILLVFALVPLGIVGVALSRLARIATWPVRIVVLKKSIGLDPRGYLDPTVRCLLAAFPVGAGVALLQLSGWASGEYSFWVFALPVASLAIVTYALLLWLIATAENRQFLRAAGSAAARAVGKG